MKVFVLSILALLFLLPVAQPANGQVVIAVGHRHHRHYHHYHRRYYHHRHHHYYRR